jgi:hypothetical protein
MKIYSHAPDVDNCIEKIRLAHHEELEGVKVTALFVFDDESAIQVLKHQGYAAGAVVRITPLKDRALGMADATIVVDRSTWLTLSQRQRDALVDHELTHLEVKTEEPDGAKDPVPVYDGLGRPMLLMRKHDHQFGWFDEVAKRHGQASGEVRQARMLMESSGQLYFDFGPRAPIAAGTFEDGTKYAVERTERDDDAMSTTGRRIQASAAKAERKKRRDAANPLN